MPPQNIFKNPKTKALKLIKRLKLLKNKTMSSGANIYTGDFEKQVISLGWIIITFMGLRVVFQYPSTIYVDHHLNIKAEGRNCWFRQFLSFPVASLPYVLPSPDW